MDHHREVLKLDPNYIDAGMTIGLYEYVVGSLPLPIKVVAGITGFRGSKKSGLEMLERVAKEGTWATGRCQASLLMVLYNREKRYADVLRHARELRAQVSAQLHFQAGSRRAPWLRRRKSNAKPKTMKQPPKLSARRLRFLTNCCANAQCAKPFPAYLIWFISNMAKCC